MRATLTPLALALGAAVASNIDPNTGIAFQTYTSTAGYNFGIALPEVPTTDFIGQLVFPTTGSGYGGLSLTGEMVNSLLIVAWPDGDDVVASFRYTTAHSSPSVYAAAYAPDSTLSITQIANGTYVNSTHASYTFLCGGCVTSDSLSFPANASSATFGWSLSANPVTSPESVTAAALQFHNAGYGQFPVDLDAARSTDFEAWAATANNTKTNFSYRKRVRLF